MSRGPTPFSGAQVAAQLSPEELAGQQLIGLLQALLKTALMYAPGHPSVNAQAQRMITLLENSFDALGVDQLPLLVTQDYVYLGRDAIRPDDKLVDRVDWVRQQFTALGISELRLRVGITLEHLTGFVSDFVRAHNAQTPMPELNDGGPLEVLQSQMPAELEELLIQLRGARRGPLLQIYAEGLARTREWAERSNRGHHAANVVAKRIVGQVVDAIAADTSGMLGMVTLQPRPGSFTNRRFDAAIVATAIARAMGLTDHQALDIGIITLVRPTPPTWPAWWVRKPLAPSEAAELVAGVSAPLERVVAFEACAPGGTALPAAWYGERRAKHLATRIVELAEGYVDLLQPGEASSPFSPEMAVQMLQAKAGTLFDPVLVELLTGLLGYFPPGTLVTLNSGDTAVVVNAPALGSDLRRPSVRPVRTDARETYHLAKPELSSYQITGTVSRARVPCNPMYVFLQ
jgi:hypothetical protein